MGCGRIRKTVGKGLTKLLDDELSMLKFSVISLEKGDIFSLETGDREYGFLLISGECKITTDSGMDNTLGPRMNPWKEKAWAALITREEKVLLKTNENTFLAVGSAPAEKKFDNVIVTPDMTGGGLRGKENWQREVRYVVWSDNSCGNTLLIGETVAPDGNWATMPPHRHQYYIPEEEVPYEEVYYFNFTKPQGFGLVWQFDDEGKMDQAFSIKNNDLVYMDKGYHPVVCGPGSSFYQVTMMAGPYRMSKSRVHDDYKFILEEHGMDNPYFNQHVK